MRKDIEESKRNPWPFLVRCAWIPFALWTIAEVNIMYILFMIILPFSRYSFRWIAETISFYMWPFFCYTTEVMGLSEFHWYGDDVPMRESAIIVCNHVHLYDWSMMFSLAYRKGTIGSIKPVIKDSVLWIPFIGGALQATGTIFVSRKWETDRKHLMWSFKNLREDKLPFWLYFHPEGSRLTKQKLEDAQAFSRNRNLPVLNHLLLPRVKGFAVAVEQLRDVAGAVYDMTLKYEPKPTMNPFRIVLGKPRFIAHCHIRRFDASYFANMSEEQIGQWLYERYKVKDDLLDGWEKTHSFPDPELNLPLNKKWIIKQFWWWFPLFVLPTMVGSVYSLIRLFV